jgi:hypothetical protein
MLGYILTNILLYLLNLYFFSLVNSSDDEIIYICVLFVNYVSSFWHIIEEKYELFLSFIDCEQIDLFCTFLYTLMTRTKCTRTFCFRFPL